MQNAVNGKDRIAAIDLARALALIAMAIYHFTWDLEFFGYAAAGTAALPGWKLFARSIASTFLFIVGVSLVLAHGEGVRWPAFGKRLAQIAAAATLITLGTWKLFPDSFIFFGILHEIAFASVSGLLFLRMPWPVTALASAAAIALPLFWRDPAFAHPALWWTGLAPVAPRSNDYVPVFPWFGAVLAGMAAAQLALGAGLFSRLAVALPASRLPRWAGFISRHSLAFYLIHQPLLLGLLWVAAQIHPASISIEQATPGCRAQCVETRDEAFCEAYCACVLETLDGEGIITPVIRGKASPEQTERTEEIARQCVAQTESDEDQGKP